MGEYAKRNDDGVEVKIGTCEHMYYLRYEDLNKVTTLPGNLDPNMHDLDFRLPFPDEDGVAIGEYTPFDRALRLYRKDGERFTDESTVEYPGIMQLRHEASGLLINVPCYHGHKLPDLGPNAKAFWNGKGHSLELSSITATAAGVLPVVRCRHCHNSWRYSWVEIWEFIEPAMQVRLRVYADQQAQNTVHIAHAVADAEVSL